MDGVDLKTSSPVFHLTTVQRLDGVFGSSYVKCHSTGDVSLITPWLEVNKVADVDKILQKGALVIPLEETSDTIRCFHPCGGIDPDTDEVPVWAEDICLKELVPNIDTKQLYPLRKPGIGKMSFIRNTDFTSIISGQVFEGDLVVCRGQWHEVFAVSDDAFYPEGLRNCVRFTHDAQRNINKQRFDIIRWPKLQGKILMISKNNLNLHESVCIKLNKINSENIGTLQLSFRNACFNSLGYLTHDTYVI